MYVPRTRLSAYVELFDSTFYHSTILILQNSPGKGRARVLDLLKPGKFDIWGGLHIIFPVFVVLATAAHFYGIVSAHKHRYHHHIC